MSHRSKRWPFSRLVFILLTAFGLLSVIVSSADAFSDEDADSLPQQSGSAVISGEQVYPASTLLSPPSDDPSAKPAWQDQLDGKADSGAASLSGPQSKSGPSSKVTVWEPSGSGQAASLGAMDAYIGYSGGRLKADQGAIVFKYKPAPNLAGIYAQRHATWTDFGQNKPPQSGFLIDTIGWNAAPRGSFTLVLNPAIEGGLAYGVWDGSKWHYVIWTAPKGWQWDPNRWYEIGVTWGSKGLTILVDGEQKASLPDVVQVNTAIPWFLGQGPWYWPYGPHTMIGSYDSVRVYNEQVGPYASASVDLAAARSSPTTAPTKASQPTASTPPYLYLTATPTRVVGAASAQTSQPTKPNTANSPGSTVSPQSTRTSPGPIEQTLGSLDAMPGGATGPVAGVVTTLDAVNFAERLPGGMDGQVAKTVESLPGGTAMLCSLPLIIGIGLIALLAALLGFLGGRRGTRERLGTTPLPAAEFAIPPSILPPPPMSVPTTPVVRHPVSSPPPTTIAGASVSPDPSRDSDAVFCEQCGSPNKAGFTFCGKCGARVEAD